jgi:hypothetical protein
MVRVKFSPIWQEWNQPSSKYIHMLALTCRYLSDLKDSPDLILTYSKWVLAAKPLRALTIFTQPNSPLDPYETLKHLEGAEGSLSLRIAYLEHLIHKVCLI